MSIKLAEALLIRKQLEAKVKRLEPIKMGIDQGLFNTKTERRNINENVDEIKMTMPRISTEDFCAEYDHTAMVLRKLDTAIQKANWAFDIEFDENLVDSKPPKATETKPTTAEPAE